jgi:NTE family protein
MRTGLILGGGGEVGVAWELGVLSALKAETGFSAADCAVVVGTSAGALAGLLAVGGADPAQLLDSILNGPPLSPVQVEVGADGDPGRGSAAIPDEVAAVMMTPYGSAAELAVAIGKVALTLPTALTQEQFVAATAAMTGMKDWPAVDFRATSVQVETGRTVLWGRESGVDLNAAISSSYSIPGFLPPVEINGAHYFDVPREHYLADLLATESLDALVYVALDVPVLVNSDELAVIADLTARSFPVVNVSNGPAFAEVAADLMNPAVRARAAELGKEDGSRAAPKLARLLES